MPADRAPAATAARYLRDAAGGLLAGIGAASLLGLPLALIVAAPLVGSLVLAWQWGGRLPWLLVLLAPATAIAAFHLCKAGRMLATWRPAPDAGAAWPVVERADAPALFAEVDAVAGRMGMPTVDQIGFHDACNASIQVKRRWIPGAGSALVLKLGFPLMATISPAQLRAVLAHELGHVGGMRAVVDTVLARLLAITSGNIPGTSRTQYARGVWAVVAWVGRVCSPTAERGWRRLAHSCEYRSDRAAARCCGPALMAETLAVIGLATYTLSTRWWPVFFPATGTGAAPAAAPFGRLLADGPGWPGRGEQRYWLDEALLCSVVPSTTHPLLGDRIQMLLGDCTPALEPVDQAGSALSTLLPLAVATSLADTLDRRWPQDAADAWDRHVARCEWLRRERDQLLCRRTTQALPAHAVERLGWLQRELGEADWRATVDEALASGAQDLTLATSMAVEEAIETGDTAAALRLLDQCAGHSVDMDRHCHRWQLRLLHARGADPAALRPLRLTVAAEAREAYADAEEWEEVAPAGTVVPFELPDLVRDDVSRALQRVRAVARSVSLLRQQSRRCADRHRLVVVVVPDVGWQETVLDRLRICDSHQRLRCRHLLESVSLPDGIDWLGTVQMPDSRLAGRVARGKVFALTL